MVFQALSCFTMISMRALNKLITYSITMIFCRVLAELPQDVRYNIEGIDILIRAHLINVGRDFDPLLAQVSRLVVFFF